MNKKVLIGSEAIKYWFPFFPREPKDRDIAVEKQGVPRNGRTEYLYNPVLVKHCNELRTQLLVGNNLIPNPDVLLTVKASHLLWDLNWEKHMFDACFLVKQGAKIDEDLFFKLFEFMETIHGKRKNSDLSMDAEAFFDNAVNGKTGYDHDFIHTLINERPTYQKVLMDGKEVEPCPEKFKVLSYDDKKALFEEEIMVMAYERFNKIGYRHAFTRMFKKFIMNHAPIWGVPFIVQNYLDMERPSFNYYKKIENHGENLIGRS